MDFKQKVKNSTSLKQIFDVVNQEYKTEESLGMFSGNIVKNKIPEIVKLLNLKKR